MTAVTRSSPHPPAPHGAGVYRHGAAPHTLLDASCTLHPGGPPAALLAAAGEALHHHAGFYPDATAQGVHGALANRLGIGTEHLLLCHGASEAIQLLCRCGGTAVRLFDVEYGEVLRELHNAGRPVNTVPLPLESPSLPPLLETLHSGETAWVTCPHNPTGTVWNSESLEQLLNTADHVVVDASLAFAAPPPCGEAPGEAAVRWWLSQAADRDNLTVILSLTKHFACPGLRLGLVAGSAAGTAHLKALQTPWPLGAAEVAALGWIAENPWPDPPAEEDTTVLRRGLTRMGFRVLSSPTHYFLAAPPAPVTVDALATAAARYRVLLRPVPGGWLRFRSLGDDNRILLELVGNALKEVTP